MKSIYELIAAKRDGRELEPVEIERVVKMYTRGEIADYHMSAFLMAAFIRGLNSVETAALTQSMLHSGDVVAIRGLDRP